MTNLAHAVAPKKNSIIFQGSLEILNCTSCSFQVLKLEHDPCSLQVILSNSFCHCSLLSNTLNTCACVEFLVLNSFIFLTGTSFCRSFRAMLSLTSQKRGEEFPFGCSSLKSDADVVLLTTEIIYIIANQNDWILRFEPVLCQIRKTAKNHP